MAFIPIEKLAEKIDGNYRLTILASLRAREILQGAKPLVDMGKSKITNIVLQEIMEGKVREHKNEEK